MTQIIDECAPEPIEVTRETAYRLKKRINADIQVTLLS